MITSRPTTQSINTENVIGEQVLPWLHRGMEALWLLTVFWVPLVFLGQDYAIAEARIGYVEVPKVALLRIFAGLILLLWLVEWAIKGRLIHENSAGSLKNEIISNLQPLKALTAGRNWLGVHPIRWFIFSAGLVFSSTVLSTLFSGSFITSMWGEIPGQDGYAAYSIGAYFVLFGVVATHLKNRGQVARLIGTVVLMGLLVGLYGIFQHFGHDFLGITESSGGGSSRVTIFMGNTIFAGAVLSMTVPATLLAFSLILNHDYKRSIFPLGKLKEWYRDSIFTILCSAILATQLLGLMFTFSRGPWIGTILALLVQLFIFATVFGWRLLLQAGLALGLSGVFVMGFLHYSSSISIIGVGSWFGIFIALIGLVGTVGTLFIITRYNRAILFLALSGVVVTILAVAIVGPSAISTAGKGESTVDGASAVNLVTERITSVKTDVLGGLIGGRGTHWQISWELVKNRPWFEFDTLHFRWIRPFVGYGPDLFRYTYLLESPADLDGFRLLEPDHAHNFFIHQIVEQGIFGLVSSLALFLSVFVIALQQFVYRRKSANPLYRMLLFGLMAIVLGRFFEMMVGVARVSDLTVLWMIFALFAALINLDGNDLNPVKNLEYQSENLRPDRANRRGRRLANRTSAHKTINTTTFIRLAVVACVIGGIGVVTWQKSVNPVRAAISEGKAVEYFEEGDLENAVKQFDKAIELSPGVPSYYNNRAQVFVAYLLGSEVLREPKCATQNEMDYRVCLGLESYNSNWQSVADQPFNYRARVALGNSASNVQLYEQAIDAYKNASSMVPNSWSLRNDLAGSLINGARYKEAIVELDRGLEITGEAIASTQAFYLKGRSLKEQGLDDEALIQLKKSLSTNLVSESAEASLNLITEVNDNAGNTFNVHYFNDLIERNPNDYAAYYHRALAHLWQGNFDQAFEDAQKTFSGGLILTPTQALQGYTYLKVGMIGMADGILSDSLNIDPQNAWLNSIYGELQSDQRNFCKALYYLENANLINSELGHSYLERGKVLLAVGLEDSAREVFATSQGTELFSADDYAERGRIQWLFENFDSALKDLNAAIKINPNRADFYWIRAKIHVNLNKNIFALTDINRALEMDPKNYNYLLGRGVLYSILGDAVRSSADFAIVETKSRIQIPQPADRDATYFTFDWPSSSFELKAQMTMKLEMKRANLNEIEYYSSIPPSHTDYFRSLVILAQTYLDLKMWNEVISTSTTIIDLDQTYSEGYRFRGDAKLALNRTTEAIEDYTSALILNPSTGINYLRRGFGFANLGEFELARMDFNEAIRMDSYAADGYKLLGYISIQVGNYGEALPNLDRSLEICPLNHDALYKRAEAYAGLGQADKAFEDLEQALRLDPANPDYLYTRGLIHLESGNPQAAVDDFTAAINSQEGLEHVDPKYANPFVDRGRAFLLLGKYDEAILDGETAISLIAENFHTNTWKNLREIIKHKTADALELLGEIYTETGNIDQAELEYSKAVDLKR